MAIARDKNTIFDELSDFTTQPRVLLIAAMGLVAGTGGVAAGWTLLHLISFVTQVAYWGHLTASASRLPVWTVLIPIVGGLIIGLMARFGSEKIRGHGIPEAIEAILLGGSRMGLKVAILKPISSAISIGTGGPFGAEGPIIMTGGAIGSLFAQLFAVTDMERKTLLVAGACAGMTAVFGTPVAAMLLAVELLLFELKPRSFLPVAVACITAAVERGYLLPPGPLFPFTGSVSVDIWHSIGWVGIGLLAGFSSALLTILVYGVEDGFERLAFHWMWWPALGGLAVGIGGLVDSHALGVGYANITQLLSGDLAGTPAVTLLVVKALIWAIALGSGTSGGVLAPLLIIGGSLGAVLAPYMPGAAAGFWPVLGMAAMMGGTMRAPLTATVFAVELTGNHHLLLPAAAACMTAYMVTVLLMKRSILTEKLARRGHHITREYSIDLAAFTRVRDIMCRSVDTLNADMTVGDAIGFFLKPDHHHRAYPVIRSNRTVAGLVSRADILAWIGNEHPKHDMLSNALAGTRLPLAAPDETISAVTIRMMAHGAPRIVVTDPGSGELLGILSRGDLIKLHWREYEAESIRTAHLRPLANRGKRGAKGLTETELLPVRD